MILHDSLNIFLSPSGLTLESADLCAIKTAAVLYMYMYMYICGYQNNHTGGYNLSSPHKFLMVLFGFIYKILYFENLILSIELIFLCVFVCLLLEREFKYSSAKAPTQGVMKCTILVDPSLVIMQYYMLSLSDVCPGIEKNFLKKYINFKRFPLKIISPWGGRGS